MEKMSVLNINGNKVKDITLKTDIWGIEPNDTVLYDAIRLTRNALRQGTHSTKTRSEVSGGGRKPWRQKGTGHARQGSIRAPQWRHGGIVFGPKPRDYSIKMNKKESLLAIKSALSYKVLNNELIVVDNLNIENSKTKEMKNILNNLDIIKEKVLIVVDELTDNLILATRNLENIMLLDVNEINTYDIVSADKMMITAKAVEKLEEVLV